MELLHIKLMIMQQPAAFRDGIIVGWCMKELGAEYENVMMQHARVCGSRILTP